MSHYKTPDALRHDAHSLAEDAQALLNATSQIADESVASARRRLELALDGGREKYGELKDRAIEGARAADQYVRARPYQSIAIAFGIGALLGFLLPRRS